MKRSAFGFKGLMQALIVLAVWPVFGALAGFGPPDGPRYGMISGYKFEDLNKNGQDNAEPRLSGWTITLESLGSIPVSRSTQTNSQGSFSFMNLPLQKYRVCEVIPTVTPPWVPSTAVCFDLTLTSTYSYGVAVFGNYRDPNGNLGCTRTQGYWGSSPAGQQRLIELVSGTMTLGNSQYSAAQLDSILDLPTGGNALLILAHQLIAAKLNILNGASGTSVLTTISQADVAIGALVIPPVGSSTVDPSSELGQQMTALATTLDTYNNGNAGVPHCD
ncbi:MAG: hypothetical protein RJB38_1954 [Pseudomonadota bacterium]|jgi:hypothetical protein